MCSNYRPVTRVDRLLTFFGVEYGKDEVERDVYPLGMAPFIRRSVEGQEAGRPALVAEDGLFGLLPPFARELKYGRRCYYARAETVARLPSFRDAWARGQRCIVPVEAFYEPCYETGRAVRWRIGQDGDVPLGIAGVYTEWRHPEGRRQFTFAMLTVNADGHPLLSRMHAPGDEKRMVLILDREDYLGWLACDVREAPRYFRQWSGPLVGEPAPAVPPAKPAPAGTRASIPPLAPASPASERAPSPPSAPKRPRAGDGEPPAQGELF
jgi:putative SOS response-associated peptidase YedK